MGIEVAGNCFHWSQLPHPSSSSPQTLASVYSSLPSSKTRAISARSQFLGAAAAGELPRRRSFDGVRRKSSSKELSLRRAFSASLDGFADDDDDEFVRRLQELALQIHQEEEVAGTEVDSRQQVEGASPSVISPLSSRRRRPEPPWLAVRPEWPGRDEMEIVPASVEHKAKSVDLPLSLRIIKRKKKRLEEGFREAGEAACCSVKRAFSSMVFIIRELQSYTLQMREALYYENLQGILARVHGDMNASFVWLFQQIFSTTPTLMLYVMLLLANFTVYSVGHNAAAIAAMAPPTPPAQAVVAVEQTTLLTKRFDAASAKTFSAGRAASVGGAGAGGGKVRPVAGATDDGRPDGSSYQTILPEGASTAPATVTEEGGVTEEEEAAVWNRIVEEASRMQASLRGEALTDPEILRLLVSPVTVEVESEEDYPELMRTELMYHQAVSQDPDNSLLLSNFAQFLYLVLHDHDRAEYYFKRAVGVKPADPESLSRYANFLWLARKDLGAAEETFLEAIAADPSNTYYAANYANFLWNTGGEETCYPLDA